MNLMMLLEMAAAGMGERVAVQCARRALDARRAVRGRRPPGRGGSALPASSASRCSTSRARRVPLALFASAWAGKPFVPINYRLTGAEVDALIERVTPVLLVTDRERAKSLAGSKGVTLVVRDDLLAEARAAADAPAAGLVDGARGDRDLALHQRHHGRPEGGAAAPSAPGLLHPRQRRVHERGRGRRRAGVRAPLPRGRHGGAAELDLLGPAHRPAAGVLAEAWLELAETSASPTPSSCRPCWRASWSGSRRRAARRRARCGRSPTAAARCRCP